MIDPANATVEPQQWIDALMAHVLADRPMVSRKKHAAEARRLHAAFGGIDPVDVAEADWDYLSLE